MIDRNEVLRRALNEEKLTLDNVETYILSGLPSDPDEGLEESHRLTVPRLPKPKRRMSEGSVSERMASLLEYMATWDERMKEHAAETLGLALPSPEERAVERSQTETDYMKSLSVPVSRSSSIAFRTGR